jgi:hypothetical protein
VQPAVDPAALVYVRWWWRVAGVVATVGLVAGCDVGSIRRPAPVRTPPPPAASASTRSAIVEVRQVRAPIPMDFALQTLTFVDSARGYALYARCGENSLGKPGCEASLVATMDGGRTWSVRRHPRPFATSQQLVVSDNGAVMLLADPYGWYLSRDGGLTFRHTGPPGRPPDDYYTVPGRFQVFQSQTGPSRVVEYVNGRRRDLPVQPPLGGRLTSVKYDESGRLWAAGLAGDGRPVAALSRDDGRTWQRQEVPGQAGPLDWVSLEISAGASDVWLLASPGPPAFPSLWLFDGAGWAEQPAIGSPPQMQSAAALGNRVLAVSVPADRGGLVVPPRYRESDWPLAGADLTVLADGTLMASTGPSGEVFLGLGHGTDRQWVQVILVRS